MMIRKVPDVVFQTTSTRGVLTTSELFDNKKILAFSLPGAFTPICSKHQLPRFEEMYQSFRKIGIDEVYCISVNDAYTMKAWSIKQKVQYVKMIPDGCGIFTRLMGMLVDKCNAGLGMRSWRYAFLADNGNIIRSWIEPGLKDLAMDDPYGETNPEKIYEDLVKN